MQILHNLCNRIARCSSYKEGYLSNRSVRVMAMLIDKRELYIGKNVFSGLIYGFCSFVYDMILY